MSQIPKSYEPREVEKKWYAAWQQAGCFAGREPVKPGKPAYSIVIPPPNVTGVLTMGHVLNNTLQDILIRRARLEGNEAMWLPGTDHAGIATQTVVERELRKEKKTRHHLGREKFLEKVWGWREEKGGVILKQLQALGASADWDRTQFTMDAHYSKAVLTVFVDLFAKGHIYRGKRMVNWCPVSLTALSDEEVIMKPTKGSIYQVRYELVNQPGHYIEVKTTRPETIPGDVAIAVHPDDPRYTTLIGQKVWRPLNRAQIPIIADAAVDKEFGSGALKITPAHDKVDFEVGQRHKLPPIDVLDPDGTLNALAGSELAGMERFAGRKKAAELLKESGALVKEEPYENNVGYSERADVPIEPRLTWQWWLKYPRVEEAKAAVRDGHIKFYPERWSKVYLHWLENIQDWCISRQLWWGHRIPVWYKKGLDKEKLTEDDLRDPVKVHVSLEGPGDPENWNQEDDVLDTWASSWLWPFATLGWPDQAAMKKAGFDYFYPTATLVTGPDIIFFWVARMIMAGLEFVRPGEPLERRIPFKNVYFTGIIRDQQGRKMSKSLGNSPDPLDLIGKYGADGLRFGIVSIAPQGQDIRFQEDRIESGKGFCNKLWNAARFRQMNGAMADNSSLAAILARLEPAKFDADDHGILDRLLATAREVDRCFTEFEFSAATQAIYSFFWNDFCDWYVEVSKAKVQDASAKANSLALQDLVLRETLLQLHPFAPFITEELWHSLGYGPEGSFIMRDASVEGTSQLVDAFGALGVMIDLKASAANRVLQLSASKYRADKAAAGLAGVKLPVVYYEVNPAYAAYFTPQTAPNYARIFETAVFQAGTIPDAINSVTGIATFGIQRPAGDTAAEKARLTKELESITKHIAGTEARLANEAFVSKAPPAVLEGARKQLADQRAKKAELEKLLSGLA